MTIAFVSSTGADAGSVASSTTLTITGFNAGNQMLVMARVGSTTATVTLTVSGGSGTFTQDGSVTDSTNSDKLYWWRCTNGSSITQIQLAVSATCTVRWAAHWYSVGTGNTLTTDQTNNGTNSSNLVNGTGQQVSSGNVTTTVAAELLLGFQKTENAHATGEFTAGTSYSYRQSTINKLFTEDQIVSSTGTYSAAFITTVSYTLPDGANAVRMVIQTYYEQVAYQPRMDYNAPFWNWYEF